MPTHSAEDADRGFELFDAGRYDEAARVLRAVAQRGLAKDARGARVLVGLALSLRHAGREREGLARLREAAKWPLPDATVRLELARAFVACGAPHDAIASARLAVANDPGHADAHLLLADLLARDDAFDEAETHYRDAIALDARWSVPHANFAALQLRRGRLDEAMAGYEAALACDPGDVEAANGRGATALAAGRHAEAVARLERARTDHPNHAATRLNLGRALREIGDIDAALELHRGLVTEDPSNAEAWDALARDLALADDDAGALAAQHEALARAPRRVDFHVHEANLLADANQLARAAAACRVALKIDASSALARWNLALIELAQGDYERGWKDYEARWRCADFPSPRRAFDVPALGPGQRVAGLRVLVHAEQGYGDTLQFLRYVPQLETRGATVVLEVQGPLVRVASRLVGARTVVARGDAWPAIDAHVPMMSLPLLLQRFAPDAASVPYLPIERVAAQAKPRVALAWAGSARFANDRRRSLRLATLAPLLARDDVEWIGLQHEVPHDDAPAFDGWRERHPHLADGLEADDFEDTARRLAGVDLVIAVDTAVAHLAGASATPVWIALPFAPDFRWLLGRDDSPWYPTARLFRQRTKGDWVPVVAALALALDAWVADRSARRVELA